MNKPARSFAKPLRDVAGKIVGEVFTRQGFASAELVTRWSEIVGPEIAAHSEPVKIQWQRSGRSDIVRRGAGARDPGAAGRRPGGNRNPAPHQRDLRARQPLPRLAHDRARGAASGAAAAERAQDCAGCDPAAVAGIAASLPDIADDDLRQALARLGAAVKRA